MVARAVRTVHDEVAASARPELPIYWSEYNASYMSEPDVEDAPFMGPWLANNIRQCDGLNDGHVLLDLFGRVRGTGRGEDAVLRGVWLIAVGHIPKASFNAFALLHDLGTERIAITSNSALATRRKDGTLAMAVWTTGRRRMRAKRAISGLRWRTPHATASIRIVDAGHGSAQALWKRMGSPSGPTREQQRELIHAAAPPVAEVKALTNGRLMLNLAPHALALLEIRPATGGR